jgi:membrane-bound lytic murein transglycosylase B
MTCWWALLIGCGAAPEVAPVQAAPPAPAPVVAPPAPAPASDLTVRRDVAWIAPKLTHIEQAIRDPAVSDADAAALGHLQQRIYRLLAEDPVLATAVDKVIDPEVRPWVRSNVAGTAAIARTVPRPKTDLPPWRIVEPAPMATLLAAYHAAEAEHRVPWHVLAAIHLNETRLGRLRGTSDAGAQGPMQFMPGTWEAYGKGDVESDADAISAAGRYLAAMGWAKDPRKALWHYNHSDDYIDAILAFSSILAADERAFRGYWSWQVYYRTVRGSIWLQPGYAATERQPIEAWCAGRGPDVCPTLGDEAR